MFLKKRIFFTLAIIALLFSSHSKAADSKNEETEAYDGSHFKRVTFVVSDLDRALTVYRDILGFEVAETARLGKDSYAYPAFNIPPEANIRFATLSSPGLERSIGLKEVTGIDLPKPTRPSRVATVIRSSDIERDFAKIEALGLEVMPLKLHERENPKFHYYERAFVDYDGHVIALYEVVQGAYGKKKENTSTPKQN